MSKQEMTLSDWFDDLCVRFILNLPVEERSSVERICFQVEEAQWYYEDFIRPLNPNLPSMNLKPFSQKFFQHIFSGVGKEHYLAAFSRFVDYKTRVPVRGAILLNDDMDKVILVKGWKKGARWSFPRGKINKDEKDLDCAIREVYEETGFDITKTNLAQDEANLKSIKISMREQEIMVFIFRGVPIDTMFEPQTRKEISEIAWYKVSDLPTMKGARSNTNKANQFYMVAPFVSQLVRWIDSQRKAGPSASASQMADKPPVPTETDQFNSNATVDGAAALMRMLNIGSRANASGSQSQKTVEPTSLVPSGILSSNTNSQKANPLEIFFGQPGSLMRPMPSESTIQPNRSVSFGPADGRLRGQHSDVPPRESIPGHNMMPAESKPVQEQPSHPNLSKHSQNLLSIFTSPSPRPTVPNPDRTLTSGGSQPNYSNIVENGKRQVGNPGPSALSLGTHASGLGETKDFIEESPGSSEASPAISANPSPAGPNALRGQGTFRPARRGRGASSAISTGWESGRRATSDLRNTPQRPITILARPKDASVEGTDASNSSQKDSPAREGGQQYQVLSKSKSAFDMRPARSPTGPVSGSVRRGGRARKENQQINTEEDSTRNTRGKGRRRSRSRRVPAGNRADGGSPTDSFLEKAGNSTVPIGGRRQQRREQQQQQPRREQQQPEQTSQQAQPAQQPQSVAPSPGAEESNRNFFLGFLARLEK